MPESVQQTCCSASSNRNENREADQLSNLAMDTDQAVDDILKMWKRGDTNRASYVRLLVHMADVEEDGM